MTPAPGQVFQTEERALFLLSPVYSHSSNAHMHCRRFRWGNGTVNS